MNAYDSRTLLLLAIGRLCPESEISEELSENYYKIRLVVKNPDGQRGITYVVPKVNLESIKDDIDAEIFTCSMMQWFTFAETSINQIFPEISLCSNWPYRWSLYGALIN